MRLSAILLAGTALSLGSPAFAADIAADAQTPRRRPNWISRRPTRRLRRLEGTAPAAAQDQEIVVTARKRQETLKDVPVAATAITGDLIEKRGFTSVKDIATLTPSLNINSDGAGRAFVSIRGVGTTLIDTIQPGVGIFVDGIYQPNTSYLNNPLTDVERVEVLRGPQGTLYGKNTLGGAISVITRQPTNEFEGRVIGSYAGPDNAWTAGASISGPIITDRLQARIAFTHQQQDGFIRNELLGKDQNPLNTDALNGTIKAEPIDDVKLTVNGYYTWLKGGACPMSSCPGRPITTTISSSTRPIINFSNIAASTRSWNSRSRSRHDVTLIGSYDQRGVTHGQRRP